MTDPAPQGNVGAFQESRCVQTARIPVVRLMRAVWSDIQLFLVGDLLPQIQCWVGQVLRTRDSIKTGLGL